MLNARLMNAWLAPALLAGMLALPGAAHADFAAFLESVRSEAREAGIRDSTLDRALSGVAPIERVIELDQRQPEGRLTFVEYRDRVVSQARIDKGRKLLAEHRELLDRIEWRYGVPGEVIVALWGIESSFGQFKGRFPVVDALATLAYDGRRAAFFRKELVSALRILDNGDIEPEGMFGSWAGAMGQSQFMPSTYLGHAVDFDGDGRRDIWGSLPDVFGSMGHFLGNIGWDRRYIWGREVKAPASLKSDERGLDHKASLASWQAAGVRKLDGSPLPNVAIDASLINSDDGKGPSYLVYDNFRALMRWNRSTYFALSVGLLSDAIKAGSQ